MNKTQKISLAASIAASLTAIMISLGLVVWLQSPRRVIASSISVVNGNGDEVVRIEPSPFGGSMVVYGGEQPVLRLGQVSADLNGLFMFENGKPVSALRANQGVGEFHLMEEGSTYLRIGSGAEENEKSMAMMHGDAPILYLGTLDGERGSIVVHSEVDGDYYVIGAVDRQTNYFSAGRVKEEEIGEFLTIGKEEHIEWLKLYLR